MGFWLLVYLIDGIIFGLITRHVAQSKGYDGGFCWGFFLGVIGLLVVGFRPNLMTTMPVSTEYKPMYGGALKPEEKQTWTCVCGAKNSYRLDYCPICRQTRDAAMKPDVTCPHCGAKNNASRMVCVLCDKPLDGSAPSVEEKLPSGSGKPDANGIELLERLAKLHEQGALTDEEFNQKKLDILQKI